MATFIALPTHAHAMSGWPVSAKQIKQKLKAIICPHATATFSSKSLIYFNLKGTTQ